MILVHPFPRRFPSPDADAVPRAVLRAAHRARRRRDARRRGAATNAQASPTTARGQTCHPLQPFVEWKACDAAPERLGAVLIAGCRDSLAARQLGFVPVHGLGAALEMARGRGARRIGYLLAPPYFPVTIGTRRA